MPVATIAPDKFKGTLDAPQAAAAMARGVASAGYDEVRIVPLADGGDGTLDALLAALGGSRRSTRVTGPLGAPVVAEWAMGRDGTAIVEMARASGLALVAGRRDPLAATTRGTGELIATAVREGARRVLVCVGGSATTDGGLGALDALGWSIVGTEVIVACDVTTTFVDAARVYGPQKGAGPAEVRLLTRRLEAFADDLERRTGVDVREIAGAGAAGGLAGGLAAIGAKIEPGFEVVAAAVGLGDALEGADLVLTGEGRLDATSFEGKVVGEVLDWAADLGVAHRGVVAGQATDDGRAELTVRGAACDVLADRVWQTGEAFARAEELVEEAARTLARQSLGS